MHPRLADDLARLPELLKIVQEHAVGLLDTLDDRAAAHAPQAHAPESLPQGGAGLRAALAQFEQRWAPGFSGSAGPRYLGFVTGGATPASLAGDWLTAALDQNPTAGIDSSAPDLERETVAWLRDLFGIDAAHEGCFVSGATMSNFVGLAIAREWLGEQHGISIAETGVAALGPVQVFSGTPHSSIYKALSMLGIGRGAVRKLACLPGREAIDVAALEQALVALDGRAAIVVANAGTVNTVDFDDLAAIATLRERFPFWLHVDAAFGAFAALSHATAPLVRALSAADSICIDLHKWLNVPYDSAVQFSRRRDLQVRVFQNAAAYLGLPGERPDFVHLTPENSRRLRALATWFTLAAYGRDGHREIVERCNALAQRLGERIERMPGFRLLAPVRMNVVCFTLADNPDEARIQAIVRAVRDSGEAFITPTVLAGTWGLRAAFSNWRTGDADVDRVQAALGAALRALDVHAWPAPD
jgi:glutamate/tyrosine decarboxylase-like PLP-dependent enzyme